MKALEVNGVSKRFPGMEKPALNRVGFTLEPELSRCLSSLMVARFPGSEKKSSACRAGNVKMCIRAFKWCSRCRWNRSIPVIR